MIKWRRFRRWGDSEVYPPYPPDLVTYESVAAHLDHSIRHRIELDTPCPGLRGSSHRWSPEAHVVCDSSGSDETVFLWWSCEVCRLTHDDHPEIPGLRERVLCSLD